MRVAFYYGALREPNDQTNPYGNLLVDALARHGVEAEFVLEHSASWLRANTVKFDVMHWHWPSHEYTDPTSRDETERRMHDFVDELRLARDLGWRVVWTAHNLYPHDRTHHDLNVAFRRAFVDLATAIISHCDVAVDAVRREFHPTAPMFVIPHGNFIDVLPADVSRDEERAALGIGPDDFVYGFIGNLLPYKGLEELIDAFKAADDGRSWLLISGGTRPREYGDSIAARGGRPPADRRADLRLRTGRSVRTGAAGVRRHRAAVPRVDDLGLARPGTLMAATVHRAARWAACRRRWTPTRGSSIAPDDPGALEVGPARRPGGSTSTAARQAAWRSAVRADWDDVARRTIEAYRA